MLEVCCQDDSLEHFPVTLIACFSCATCLCFLILISSQDEYMKKKFQDLLAQEKNLMALSPIPAQVFR